MAHSVSSQEEGNDHDFLLAAWEKCNLLHEELARAGQERTALEQGLERLRAQLQHERAGSKRAARLLERRERELRDQERINDAHAAYYARAERLLALAGCTAGGFEAATDAWRQRGREEKEKGEREAEKRRCRACDEGREFLDRVGAKSFADAYAVWRGMWEQLEKGRGEGERQEKKDKGKRKERHWGGGEDGEKSEERSRASWPDDAHTDNGTLRNTNKQRPRKKKVQIAEEPIAVAASASDVRRDATSPLGPQTPTFHELVVARSSSLQISEELIRSEFVELTEDMGKMASWPVWGETILAGQAFLQRWDDDLLWPDTINTAPHAPMATWAGTLKSFPLPVTDVQKRLLLVQVVWKFFADRLLDVDRLAKDLGLEAPGDVEKEPIRRHCTKAVRAKLLVELGTIAKPTKGRTCDKDQLSAKLASGLVRDLTSRTRLPAERNEAVGNLLRHLAILTTPYGQKLCAMCEKAMVLAWLLMDMGEAGTWGYRVDMPPLRDIVFRKGKFALYLTNISALVGLEGLDGGNEPDVETGERVGEVRMAATPMLRRWEEKEGEEGLAWKVIVKTYVQLRE